MTTHVRMCIINSFTLVDERHHLPNVGTYRLAALFYISNKMRDVPVAWNHALH